MSQQDQAQLSFSDDEIDFDSNFQQQQQPAAAEQQRPAPSQGYVEDSDSDSDEEEHEEEEDSDIITKHVPQQQHHNHHHNADDDEEDEDDDDDDDEEDEDDDDDHAVHESSDAFTSIWDMVGTYAQSPLEQMLSKENVEHVTLENVLDQDTLIQEIKASNAKVIEFLSKPEHVQQLIEFLAREYYREDLSEEDLRRFDYAAEHRDEEDEEEEDELALRIYKYPYVACEVISCDVEEINDTILGSQENVLALFGFLADKQHGKTPLNPSLSQYFIKTITTLLQKNYIKVAEVLMGQKDGEAIDNLIVNNIGLCDMDNLALKILGFETADEGAFDPNDAFGGLATQQRIRELFLMKQRVNDKDIVEKKKEAQQWAVSHRFIEKLIEQMAAKPQDEDLHRNVFNILCEVAEKGPANNPLGQQLFSDSTLQRIMDIIMQNPKTSIFVIGVPFLRVIADSADAFSTNSDAEFDAQGNRDLSKLPSALAIVNSKTGDFVEILKRSNADEQLELSTGVLRPPLGEDRLRIVEHLQLLFRLPYDTILRDLLQLNALPTVLDLFFKYDYNNMLHYVVFGIVQCVLEGENMPLKEQLFGECRLLSRMMGAYEESEAQASRPKGMPKGHIGYIIELANLIRKLSYNEQTQVGRFTESQAGWKEFLDGPLERTNTTNERQLGGPVPIGANTFPHQSQYSFDEEDEEEDDDEYAEDEDDSDSDSSDEEVVVKKQQGGHSRTHGDDESSHHANTGLRVVPAGATNGDFDADFDANFA